MTTASVPLECKGLRQSAFTRLLGALGSFAFTSSIPIEAVVASDGGALWTIDRGGCAISWDPESGAVLGSLALDPPGEDPGAPVSAALSRDGSKLLLGRAGGRIALHDLTSGARLWDVFATRPGATIAPIRDVALSPDASLAVSHSHGEDVVRVWMGKSLLGEIAGAAPTAFSHDGALLCMRDAIVDVRLGRVVARLPAGSGRLSAAFSPDRLAVATGAVDGTVELFHPARREILWAARAPEIAPGRAAPVQAIAFSPDGASVVTVTEAGYQLWETASGRLVWDAKRTPGPRVAFALGRGRIYALAAGSRTSVRPFEVERAAEPEAAGHAGSITCVAASPVAPTAITGSADGTLRIWHIASGTVLRTLDGIGEIDRVAFFPDGRKIAAAGRAGVRVHDVATGAPVTEAADTAIQGADGQAALRGGRALKVIAGDGLAIVEGSAVVTRFAGSRDVAKLLALSPDEHIAITVGADGSLALWDVVGAGKMDALDLRTAADRAACAAFAPDSRSLLVGTARGVLLHFEIRVDSYQIEPAQMPVPGSRASSPGDWGSALERPPPTLELRFRGGHEWGPNAPFGRHELALRVDGRCRLASFSLGQGRAWTFRVDPALVRAALDGLRAAGFPAAPPQRGLAPDTPPAAFEVEVDGLRAMADVSGVSMAGYDSASRVVSAVIAAVYQGPWRGLAMSAPVAVGDLVSEAVQGG